MVRSVFRLAESQIMFRGFPFLSVMGLGRGRYTGKMAAAAVVRSIGSSLGRSLKELRIHLCQRSPGSQGTRCGAPREGWAGGPGSLDKQQPLPPDGALGIC